MKLRLLKPLLVDTLISLTRPKQIETFTVKIQFYFSISVAYVVTNIMAPVTTFNVAQTFGCCDIIQIKKIINCFLVGSMHQQVGNII